MLRLETATGWWLVTHPDHARLADNALTRYRTVVRRVSVGEHSAISRDEPIASPVRGGGHARDRGREAQPTRRAEEACAETEYAPVGGHEPIAPRRPGRNAHNWFVEAATAH